MSVLSQVRPPTGEPYVGRPACPVRREGASKPIDASYPYSAPASRAEIYGGQGKTHAVTGAKRYARSPAASSCRPACEALPAISCLTYVCTNNVRMLLATAHFAAKPVPGRAAVRVGVAAVWVGTVQRSIRRRSELYPAASLVLFVFQECRKHDPSLVEDAPAADMVIGIRRRSTRWRADDGGQDHRRIGRLLARNSSTTADPVSVCGKPRCRPNLLPPKRQRSPPRRKGSSYAQHRHNNLGTPAANARCGFLTRRHLS
jgi:hypothetical protein